MGAHALAAAAGMKDEGLLATEPRLMRLLNFDLITHTPFRPLEGLLLVRVSFISQLLPGICHV